MLRRRSHCHECACVRSPYCLQLQRSSYLQPYLYVPSSFEQRWKWKGFVEEEDFWMVVQRSRKLRYQGMVRWLAFRDLQELTIYALNILQVMPNETLTVTRFSECLEFLMDVALVGRVMGFKILFARNRFPGGDAGTCSFSLTSLR